ncbi:MULTISPECIES: four helix bundle protein [unclassified Leeuwenhoekiella]|uniref:four helix bundle protein n=1 Tax=unclassified Leeuwenhoekiella TaxID=2615029 RepID=UPI000C4BD0E4|nr:MULTISPECIES: four helix bundle protein [unclassified Leeuwenhoekiella]MAW95340.1 four helix bundle protein [Leeuwenhoekiella sp.]MBA81736.1 four helix bundle protein [Leeuwenhoekiella sp.]|tara:strand:+ start:5562 stop:5927 length:366 start_codon:yes stop_codon:yes gene_type:complete
MEDLKTRTKRFTIDCWKLCSTLPKSREYNNLVFQLLKSSSSVGANWRASQRPKSDADFINKLKIVEEEADESCFWLEILIAISETENPEAERLLNESSEILVITVASINTMRKKINTKKND